MQSVHLQPAKRWRPENPDFFLRGTSLATKQLWYNCTLVLHGMVEIYEREKISGHLDIFEEDAVIGELRKFLQVCGDIHITPRTGVGTPEEELKSNPSNWLAYVAGQIIPEVHNFIDHSGISDFFSEFKDKEQFLLDVPTDKLTDRNIKDVAHHNLIDHTLPSFLGIHGDILDMRETLERVHGEIETENLKQLLDRS